MKVVDFSVSFMLEDGLLLRAIVKQNDIYFMRVMRKLTLEEKKEAQERVIEMHDSIWGV